MNNRKKFTSTKKAYSFVFGLLIAIIVASLLLPAVFATTPAANTQIKNSASATYTDANGRPLTATSNEVTTFVQQVNVFTLTANGSKTATVGSQVVYPHTLTNTGNGAETFSLSTVAAGAFTHTGVNIYVDANGDGIPDDLNNVTSVSLAAGDVYKFVVVGTVPAAATGAGTIAVTATDTTVGVTHFGPLTNTDTTTVTTYASLQVTKALSTISGTNPTTTTVTLAYTNTGNATANSVIITDSLQNGWTFVPNSVRWSTTGSTVITETGAANGTSPNTIQFAKAAPLYTITINQVPANTSGFVQFDVTIAGDPGIYTNYANYSYKDGSVAGGGVTISGNRTNDVNFTIQGSAAVSITGPAATATALPGATISFDNSVKNDGDITDTFNITLSDPLPADPLYAKYPVGTTFELVKSDGNTPLVDTNGDGIPDSGPMVKGATYHVILRVTLPNNATIPPAGKSYSVNKTATSTATGVLNQGASATTQDKLTTVGTLNMDLTQNSALPTSAANGFGAYASGDPALTPSPVAVVPGASTTFLLFVNNTSSLPDTYDMFASSTEFAGSSTAGSLIPKISVTYRLSTNGTSCSAANLGATITNTTSVSAGASKLICAIVNTTSTLAGGTYNIYFLSKSPTSGAFDQIHDSIDVSTVHNVTITPNNTGQIYPGGSVVYSHTLNNGGNATEAVTFTNILPTQAGWSAVLYYDNGSIPGVLDPTDTAIAPGATFLPVAFAAGTSVDLLVKVQSVSSAAVGTIDITNLTATYSGRTILVTDASTVIAGQLRLVKTQALDTACNGAGAFSSSDITSGAKPGACIRYMIVATNEGADNVSNVVLSDSTPAFTAYKLSSQGADPVCSTGTIAVPADLASGSVKCTLTSPLAPGATVTMIYGVMINP